MQYNGMVVPYINPINGAVIPAKAPIQIPKNIVNTMMAWIPGNADLRVCNSTLSGVAFGQL
jgi:hypothetical protein